MRIETIDLRHLGRSGRIAAYLVLGPDGAVLVETGPSSCRQALLEGLAENGLEPSDIEHVFVTHIHLDHAGAAGWWARQGAEIFVHPVGAPHLVDPSRLVSSASRLYGRRMQELWGEIAPAPKERVRIIEDGEIVYPAGLEIEALSTPGHASHHNVYLIGDIAFTGDVAAIAIPGTDLVELPTPPPEFDLELWKRSLDRVRSFDLSAIYPTHFGKVDRVDRHLARIDSLLEEATETVRAKVHEGVDQSTIESAFADWNSARHRAGGASDTTIRSLEELSPTKLSLAGILRYLRKTEGVEVRR